METWDDLTDLEINKEVAKFDGGLMPVPDGLESAIIGDVEHYYDSLRMLWSCHKGYCDSWDNIGPIISDNGICLISPTKGRKSSLWSASWNEDGGKWSSGDIVFGDKNPLRAAAIVFLMMNGVNP